MAVEINMVVKLRNYKMDEHANKEENTWMTGSPTTKKLWSVVSILKWIWLMSFCKQEEK